MQRVKKASVLRGGDIVAQIGYGLLLFVGISKTDTELEAQRFSKKISNLRIFEDENGKMNYNIHQIGGSILSVPQFTLYADISRGNRPGFELAASADVAKDLWRKFNSFLRKEGLEVKEGLFGEHMKVELVNDGPVTIWLE